MAGCSTSSRQHAFPTVLPPCLHVWHRRRRSLRLHALHRYFFPKRSSARPWPAGVASATPRHVCHPAGRPILMGLLAWSVIRLAPPQSRSPAKPPARRSGPHRSLHSWVILAILALHLAARRPSGANIKQKRHLLQPQHLVHDHPLRDLGLSASPLSSACSSTTKARRFLPRPGCVKGDLRLPLAPYRLGHPCPKYLLRIAWAALSDLHSRRHGHHLMVSLGADQPYPATDLSSWRSCSPCSCFSGFGNAGTFKQMPIEVAHEKRTKTRCA